MASTVVLITGANSGVGLATTKVLSSASSSFHVVMASRSLEKATTALSEIQSGGSTKGPLSTVQLDVTDSKSVSDAAAFVLRKFGRLDVLINNAAVGSRDPDVKTRLQLCLDTNVIGPAVVSAAFRPLLLKSHNPYSIYVSSGAGSMGRSSDPTSATYRLLGNGEAYRASKAALNMIALQESIEYSETALKVFALDPGFVRSNLRGGSEEERSGWGRAGDPKRSGEMILGVLRGEKDGDKGKFLYSGGIYPW